MNIATYLHRLSRQLTVVPAKREQILEEVSNHLFEIAERFREQGVAQDQAETQAIAEFGSVGSVAAQINRVHPLHWDLRRTVGSVAIGALVTLTLSTLITSLFVLISTRAQIISSLAWDNTPFSWERFFLETSSGGLGAYAILIPTPYTTASPYAPMMLTLFLVLYGLTPFLWGSRAAQGWQAGLAYGLGGSVGMLWLIPGTILLFTQPYLWKTGLEQYRNSMLLTWLIVPFAVLASVIGRRFFTPFATMKMERRNVLQRLRAWLTTHVIGHKRIALLSMSLAFVILLFANLLVISQIVSTRVSPSILAAQLDTAQKQIVFPIRQPQQLPQGMSLRKIEYGPTTCGYCSIDLEYSNSNGHLMRISEDSFPRDPNLDPPPLWPQYDFMISQGYNDSPFWWLPSWRIFHQNDTIIADWTDGKVSYTIDFWGNFTQAEMHQVINELRQH